MFQGHSNQHSQQQQQQQQQGHGQSQVQGSSLPPLLQPGRLPELVMAGTGHNERIEGAVEHVLRNLLNRAAFTFILFFCFLGFE